MTHATPAASQVAFQLPRLGPADLPAAVTGGPEPPDALPKSRLGSFSSAAPAAQLPLRPSRGARKLPSTAPSLAATAGALQSWSP